LLSDCTVGIFPSYIEGFGLAVLEKIAAGIPVVAYDVSGPRQILKTLRNELLTREGDVNSIADRAVEILNMSASEYGALSEKCRSIAVQFRWEKIAADTAREYAMALQTIVSR